MAEGLVVDHGNPSQHNRTFLLIREAIASEIELKRRRIFEIWLSDLSQLQLVMKMKDITRSRELLTE